MNKELLEKEKSICNHCKWFTYCEKRTDTKSMCTEYSKEN